MAKIKIGAIRTVELAMPDDAVWIVRCNSPSAEFAGMAAYSLRMRDGVGQAVLERTIAIAKEVVTDWRNMETDQGLMPCTPENVELVLRHVPGFAMQFYLRWDETQAERSAEGNVSAVDSSGA